MKLTNIKPLLPFIAALLLLSSCQKEVNFQDGQNPGGGTGNNSIIGDWDFVGLSATTNATITVTSPLGDVKAVTTSGYTSKNNTGTVKITSADFIYTNFGYSIDTTMNVKTYIAGLLVDDTDAPFAFTSPATSNTTPYTRINADSLSVVGFAGVPDPTGAAPTGPVGVRIAWSGDTLLLKVATNFTQNINQGGMPATLNATLTGITKLKRR
jgi:hypothetical protein